MKTTHTPGPWKVIKIGKNFGNLTIESAMFQVAATVNAGASTKEKSQEESDARLIAAAPELLEALNDLVDQIVSKRRDQISLDKAFGAIAKAEGGQE